MMKMPKSKRLLTLICLTMVLSLATTACGDDDKKPQTNNPVADAGDTHSEPDTREETDTVEGHDALGEDTDEDDTSGGQDDCQAPSIPEDLILEEDDWYDEWSVAVQADDTYFQVGFGRDASVAAVGTYDLEAEPSIAIVTGEGCDDNGCTTYFLATAGTLTITTFEQSEGGAFEATLSDIILAEFDAEENDFVDGGAVSCLVDTSLSMSTLPIPPEPTWTAPTCADGNEGFVSTQTEVSVSVLGTFIVTAATGADYPRDELRLELYGDYEAGGVYPIDDMNYNTCETCLSIQTECEDAGGDIDADNCQTRYNAGAGTLTITTIDEASGTFEGLIEGAQFLEVTQQGLHTVNVEGGASWCVDTISLSGTAPAP